MLRQPVRTSLSDFIKTTMGSQFVIPVYQRTYTWTPEKETAKYLDDIEDILDGKTTNHFLGIIIYMDARISAMFRQLQIVDGQQRMTTSFIFLLALKKYAEEKRNASVAGMIEDYYLFNRHAEGDASFRLKPTVSNDDVFEKLIFGASYDLTKKELESSVYRNYDYIYKRIIKMSQKHSLLEILDTLSRVDVLEFPLSDTDNAQQIFESINSTGAPLTSADLIRNYILMNHNNEAQERYYRMYWQPLEKLYPQSRQLEDFFRYYLAVKTYTLHGRRDIYESFKIFWNSTKDPVEKKLQEINRYCRWCHDLFDGELYSEEADEAMNDYRRMNSRVTAPFLMEMIRLQMEEKISDHELAQIIRLLDSYIIRRNICGMDNGNLGIYFPTLLKAVLSAFSRKRNKGILSIIQTGLVEYNKGKPLAMPRDEAVRTRLTEINAYNLSCIRAVLERMEHDGATAKVDLSALNIEHIMPQHPNRWWKYNSGTMNEDDYTFCANLIGNLTLCAVYDNTRMGNEDFSFKKEVLSKTLHIRMNTEILGCELWNRDVIVLRTTEMAERITQLYPYAIAESPAHIEEEPLRAEETVSEVPETAESNDKLLVIHTPTADAKAVFHDPSHIEILAGSIMKPYFKREMRKNRNMFYSLKNDGTLVNEADFKVRFAKNAMFGSLSDAAGFLLHRGGENSAVWTYADGRQVTGTVPAAETDENSVTEPVEESAVPDEVPEGRVILLENSGVKVKAVFVNPKEVVVLKDSTIRPYTGNDMRRYRNDFLAMRARKELVHVDHTTVRFTKNITYPSLNDAACFLLHRGGENSALWTNENGSVITGKPKVYGQPVMLAQEKKEEKRTEETVVPNGIPLVLNHANTHIRAVFCKPDEIYILKGSQMHIYMKNSKQGSPELEKILINEGYLVRHRGYEVFEKDCRFTSLKEAAGFILHKDDDHSADFKHEDGRAITGIPAVYGSVMDQQTEKPKVEVRRFSGKNRDASDHIIRFAGTAFQEKE